MAFQTLKTILSGLGWMGQIVVTSTSMAGEEIEAATRIHNRIFAISIGVTVLAAIASALAGYFVWSSGNRVQDAVRADALARIGESNRKSAAAQAEGEQAKATAAEANRKASEADVHAQQLARDNLSLREEIAKTNERAAALEHAAEIARTETEQIKLNVASANERAEAAKESAAKFNEMAERERLARVRIERRLSERRALVSSIPEHIDRVTRLKLFSGTRINVIANSGDEEVTFFANYCRGMLEQAGWLVSTPVGTSNNTAKEVWVEVRPDRSDRDMDAVGLLIKVLADSHVVVGGPMLVPKGKATSAGEFQTDPDSKINLVVGTKKLF